MPAPTDKDAVRLQIIKAFQRCAEQKPLPEVSLRDVAGEMGVTHASLLYYFKNKNELLIAASRWAGSEFCRMIREWFEQHRLADYSSVDAYLDAFVEYAIRDKSNETMPRGVVMNCALGAYDEGLKAATEEESHNICMALRDGLEKALGCTLDESRARAMLVIFYGAYFCAFNSALGAEYEKSIVSGIRALLGTI